MVGAELFVTIHKRLQEIIGISSFDATTIFGGVSILAVGDLMQLPPVGDKQIFENSSSGVGLQGLYG